MESVKSLAESVPFPTGSVSTVTAAARSSSGAARNAAAPAGYAIVTGDERTSELVTASTAACVFVPEPTGANEIVPPASVRSPISNESACGTAIVTGPLSPTTALTDASTPSSAVKVLVPPAVV